MKRKKEHLEQQDVTPVKQGDRYTMEDSGTKLYIEAVHDLTVIKVDDGIVRDKSIKKCDYLCSVIDEKCVRLFELKTGKIDDAYVQLATTPEAIQEHSSYQTLLNDLDRLDAYIVSPLRVQIPNNANEKKRRLCGKLARYCKCRPGNMMDLLKLVQVVPSCNGFVDRDGQITCSNKFPLKM